MEVGDRVQSQPAAPLLKDIPCTESKKDGFEAHIHLQARAHINPSVLQFFIRRHGF
jgi:hypothetical protein